MNRQAYRQLLLTTPGLGDYISGAILFEETLYQSTTDGKKFVDCLQEQNIVPGIKVDKVCFSFDMLIEIVLLDMRRLHFLLAEIRLRIDLCLTVSLFRVWFPSQVLTTSHGAKD